MNQKGFTLIELLVTIAIIGIIGIPITGLFASSMSNNVHSRSRTTSVAVAQSAMEYYKKQGNIKLKEIVQSTAGGNTTANFYFFYISGGDDGNSLSHLLEDRSINSKGQKPDEDYEEITEKYKNTQEFDYVIKVELTIDGHDPHVVQIFVTVWDSQYKESSRVCLVSLRSS